MAAGEDDTQPIAAPGQDPELTTEMQAMLRGEDEAAEKLGKEPSENVEALPLPDVPQYEAITRRKQFQQKNNIKKEKAERKLAKIQEKEQGTEEECEIHAKTTKKRKSKKGKSSSEKIESRKSAGKLQKSKGNMNAGGDSTETSVPEDCKSSPAKSPKSPQLRNSKRLAGKRGKAKRSARSLKRSKTSDQFQEPAPTSSPEKEAKAASPKAKAAPAKEPSVAKSASARDGPKAKAKAKAKAKSAPQPKSRVSPKAAAQTKRKQAENVGDSKRSKTRAAPDDPVFDEAFRAEAKQMYSGCYVHNGMPQALCLSDHEDQTLPSFDCQHVKLVSHTELAGHVESRLRRAFWETLQRASPRKERRPRMRMVSNG